MAEIKDFGRKVKKIMKQRGITQSWLAQKIGATEATLSRYVNNSRKPQADIAAEIAEALDVSLDYLMGISGFPAPIKTLSTEESLMLSAFGRASARDRKIIFGVLEDHMTAEELENYKNLKQNEKRSLQDVPQAWVRRGVRTPPRSHLARIKEATV